MIVVFGNRYTNDEEEVGSGTYCGEEEEMEGDDDNEVGSHDGQKHNRIQYHCGSVSRLGGGKGSVTTGFICSHCTKRLHKFIYSCEKASMWDYAMRRR